MSQPIPQWSPQAIQIFTAARQLTDVNSQTAYIAQACGPNAPLRWEVEWLLQWDRKSRGSLEPNPPYGMVGATNEVITVASQPPISASLAVAEASPSISRKRWRWVIGIASVLFVFVGFIGIFAFGVYRGIRQMQYDRQVEAIERVANSQAQSNDFSNAARSYERAAEIRVEQYGANHGKVSEILAKAASAWYYAGNYEKGAASYEKAYLLDLQRVGAKNPETLDHQRYWAICLLEGRNATQALKVFEEVLAIRKEALGPAHEDTTQAMIDIGRCREKMGQSTEALASYEPAYEALRKRITAHHEDAHEAMYAIVRCFDNMGRFSESTGLLMKVYDAQKSVRGFDDPGTDSLREALCERLEKEKNGEALVRVRRELLDERVARIGADQLLSIVAKEQLADALQLLGQVDEAITLRLDCREKRLALNGKDSPEYIHCLHGLADTYNAAKKSEQGIKLFEEVLNERKSRLGAESAATIEAAAQVGWRRIQAGETEAGEADVERALLQSQQSLGNQHEATSEIARNLAAHFRRNRKFTKEMEIRRQLVQQQLKSGGIEDETTRELLENQADADLEAGNADSAIEIYRRLVDFEANRSGTAGISTYFQSRSLALAYLRAKQAEKAVECCDEVLTRLRRRDEVEYWSAWTATDMGVLCARAGNPQKSCEAYEYALLHRDRETYTGEYASERMFSYWPRQAALAGLSKQAFVITKTQLEQVEKQGGAECYHAQSLRMLLGLHAEASGEFSEAEKSYRQIQQFARGKSIGWLSQALFQLSTVLRRQAKFVDAEVAIREAISLKQQIEANLPSITSEQQITTQLDAELELAEVLLAQTKFAEAETVLVKIHEAKAKLKFDEEELWGVHCRALAIQRLIEVREKMGKPSESESLKMELGAIEAQYPGVGRL